MPKLIVNRSGRRKIPPCGRLIIYREPHSPFQKLVDSQRRKYGFSGRELAQELDVSQSTLWIWLHNTNGFPHPKAFRESHVKALAKVLKIPDSKLRKALDASRRIFTTVEDPMPHESFDSFGRFIDILKNDKRKYLARSFVLNLAKTLHNGSAVDKK